MMFSRTLSTDEEQKVSDVIAGYTIAKIKPLLICDAQKQTHMPHFSWEVDPHTHTTLWGNGKQCSTQLALDATERQVHIQSETD